MLSAAPLRWSVVDHSQPSSATRIVTVRALWDRDTTDLITRWVDDDATPEAVALAYGAMPDVLTLAELLEDVSRYLGVSRDGRYVTKYRDERRSALRPAEVAASP